MHLVHLSAEYTFLLQQGNVSVCALANVVRWTDTHPPVQRW